MVAVLDSLWRFRRVVWALARREFRARYAGSTLGAVWAVLEPAIQFGLYLTVFSFFLGMRVEGAPGVGSFGIYLISGLVPFMAFQEAATSSVRLSREKVGLLRHVNVPAEVLLAGTLVAVFARHAIALLLVIAASAALGTLSLAGVSWLAVGLALLVAGTFGLALLLVVAGAFLPDFAQLVGTATTVLFFLTPIAYPATVLPAWASGYLAWNPLWGVLVCFRRVFLGTPAEMNAVLVSLFTAALLLSSGAVVLGRRRYELPDVT
ncbi:MAG: ABC transporter permease [Acidobacteriota bacterium]